MQTVNNGDSEIIIMKKQLNFMGLTATIFLSIVALNQVSAQINIEGMDPKMQEDEILICVRDYTDNKGTICHIMPIDNIDWYQETSELNYGKFGDMKDSFSVGLVD